MSGDEQILICNAGSSSLKLGLFAAGGEAQLAAQEVAWQRQQDADYPRAMRDLLAGIDAKRIAAVGHRIVHGGSRYTQAVVIDTDAREAIAELAALAPLHNGPALAVIAAVAAALPGVPQVAAFDTAFHATLPPEAYLYGLPYDWYEDWDIRRYGFHGLSHAYCAARAAELLGQPLDALRIVTCHLGSGCSLAAIAQGRSVATTMGFTPLDGLVMATRSGSLDPGILTYVLGTKGMSSAELESTLYHESGLLGLSGVSGDMRAILAARASGEERATLAFDVYVARLREGIAAMVATLGGIDALVFAGGVGEHAAVVRTAACERLDWMGITLERARNEAAVADCEIAAPGSPVRVLVIHTREELMVARETAQVLARREPATAPRTGY